MTVRSILRWSQNILLLCGGLALGYCSYLFITAKVFQVFENRLLEQSLRSKAPPAPPSALVRPRLTPQRRPAGKGDLIGRLEIPSVRLKVIVLEGDDAGTMRLGAGHIPGTALPGEPGNVGISAHRDTFFRPLRNISRGDKILLTTLEGRHRYVVESTSIVGPDDVHVLAYSGRPSLTLVTCYPFYYVGSAPKRFVVRAREEG